MLEWLGTCIQCKMLISKIHGLRKLYLSSNACLKNHQHIWALFTQFPICLIDIYDMQVQLEIIDCGRLTNMWQMWLKFKLWFNRSRHDMENLVNSVSFALTAWCMTLPQSKVSHKDDSKVKEIIQEGCQILHLQEKPQYSQVARELTKKYSIPVPYHRLCNWFLGKSENPMHTSDSSLLSRRKFWWTGLSTLAQQDIPLANGQFEKGHKTFVEKSLPGTGYIYSFVEIQQLNWGDCWVLILNEHKHLITQLSVTILTCLIWSSKRMVFHGRTFIIWMRRVASGIVAVRLWQGNILFCAQDGQNIRCEAGISSSSQLLNVLVQMVKVLHLALSSKAKNSVLSGFRWIPIFGKS